MRFEDYLAGKRAAVQVKGVPDGYWDLSWWKATIIGYDSDVNKYIVEYETVMPLTSSTPLSRILLSFTHRGHELMHHKERMLDMLFVSRRD